MSEVTFESGVINYGGVIIHRAGGVTIKMRANCVGLCGNENARMVRREPDSPWYGPNDYCECGDHYQDFKMCPRPFQRAWRKQAQDRFEQMWEKALPEGTRVVRDFSDEGGGYISGVVLPDGTEVAR